MDNKLLTLVAEVGGSIVVVAVFESQWKSHIFDNDESPFTKKCGAIPAG